MDSVKITDDDDGGGVAM